jgi:8-oxo-dGTP pyrophosphatase MutT (NUDIX family)
MGRCRVSDVESVRPGPGEELNTGPATVPRLAATVILVREGTSGLEVLLAQRNPKAKFMGGAWVFPGGAVGAGDGEGEAGLRAAAVRELGEEAGIHLGDPARLVAFSRWITPAESKIRYDTWFFIAAVDGDAEPRIDGAEMVAAGWFAPGAALAAGRAGEIFLVFPTIKHLEQLQSFDSAAALLEHARHQTIAPVQPRIVGTGETARIVLPGDEGDDG